MVVVAATDLVLRGRRHAKGHRRAIRIVDPDLSTMCLDQAPSYSQAKTAATRLTISARVGATEPLKRVFTKIGGEARAIVDDSNHCAFLGSHAHPHNRARRCMTDGIVDQISNHSGQREWASQYVNR